jgi:hypothetical protein
MTIVVRLMNTQESGACGTRSVARLAAPAIAVLASPVCHE